MKETIIIILIMALYLFVSYKLHMVMHRANRFYFLILSIAYFLFTFYLFDLLIYLRNVLCDHKIYLDFGHSDAGLVEVMLVCYVLAVINMIIICVRRFLHD
ncbi:MAG TPA: hypothetical protein VK543_15215 [Puia sp.]|nr:hypothetical protein [Puia sp.]